MTVNNWRNKESIARKLKNDINEKRQETNDIEDLIRDKHKNYPLSVIFHTEMVVND